MMKINRRSKSLMTNSFTILAGIIVVIVIAFIVNYIVIQRCYQRDSIITRQDFFNETVNEIDATERNIERITAGMIANNTLIDYTQADGLYNRWQLLDDVKQYVANLMKLNDNIVSMCIYNKQKELIVMQGSIYIPLSDSSQLCDKLIFSDALPNEDQKTEYFYVIIPIYEKDQSGTYSKAGNAAMLFQTGYLNEILELFTSAYSNELSYISITDQKGNILAAAGNSEIWNEYQKQEDKRNKYLMFEDTLLESGWHVVSLMRHDSYMLYMNQVQIVNVITYAVIILCLLWMCYLMNTKVVLPIRKQMEFAVHYTHDMSKRLEIRDKNEFGELEKEINEMLDGIEELNQQIISEKERNFKLEYAKKQTEMIAYKNQINPHFMHNTLECIRGMALYKGEKEIACLTAAMSRMFQYNVKGNELVTVDEMLKSMKDYATIIDYRFMGKIQIQMKIQEKIREWKLPKMIVQPFVENAVQHGVEPKIEKGLVVLNIFTENDRDLKIQISDNGIGINSENLLKQQKKFLENESVSDILENNQEIGISNVARRLKLFYGNRCSVCMESRERAGTRITIILPEKIPEADRKEA